MFENEAEKTRAETPTARELPALRSEPDPTFDPKAYARWVIGVTRNVNEAAGKSGR